MIVVKVGGSLYDLPNLGPGLCLFLESLGEAILLVPGGGGLVEAVRHLDRVHNLGESQAHELALRSLGVAAEFLGRLIRECRASVNILDAYRFAVEDDARIGALPHSWASTSDSLAARAAISGEATRLILLKSIDIPPGLSWEEARIRGWVDACFPDAVARACLPIETVNFRRWLELR